MVSRIDAPGRQGATRSISSSVRHASSGGRGTSKLFSIFNGREIASLRWHDNRGLSQDLD